MPNCSPRRASPEAPYLSFWPGEGRKRCHLTWHCVQVEVAVAASCVLHQGYRVSQAVTSPNPDKNWGEAGSLPSALSPVSPRRRELSAAARELALSPLEAEPGR